jgi:prepilin-type N-terminal cleavage/methylation domain-containing protein
MITNQNRKSGGFTLVEIMIVVAIIALLASIAVPSFLRARKRSQATACLETLRMVDGAKDQYAIENGKGGTVVPLGGDLAPYVKNGSKLYTDLVGSAAKPLDPLGNIIDIKSIDTPPQVASATKGALSDALGKDAAATNAFFGGYQ